ncbi:MULTISPECIES: hypothetical protein [unclassified Paenibacillus]|uniref:hypothetical protein n=1 Tax=unclassified Paenibacillus TaxID=185978 RepID=UPI00056AA69F|nr:MULTISPECIES: hypothetical protein [unclassified Paenibacillus]
MNISLNLRSFLFSSGRVEKAQITESKKAVVFTGKTGKEPQLMSLIINSLCLLRRIIKFNSPPAISPERLLSHRVFSSGPSRAIMGDND